MTSLRSAPQLAPQLCSDQLESAAHYAVQPATSSFAQLSRVEGLLDFKLDRESLLTSSFPAACLRIIPVPNWE